MSFRKKDIVEYYDSRRIACGLILEVEDRRIRVLTEQGKEANIPLGRTLVRGEVQDFPVNPSRDEQVGRLKEISRLRDEIKNRIDLRELWEIVSPETSSISVDELAELLFGAKQDANATAALLRAIHEEGIFFKIRAEGLEVSTPERVEQALNQRNKERERVNFTASCSEFLMGLRNRAHVEAESAPAGLVSMLEEAAALGPDWTSLKTIKEIFARAGLPPQWDPFLVLVKLGVWSEDENITLRVEEIPVHFSEQATAEARAVVDRRVPISERELFEQNVVTIDSTSTRDVDDALSLSYDEDDILVGIHITDVAHFVDYGSSLDEEIRHRATSIYLPEMTIPMIPPVLSEDGGSLTVGEIRPALSVIQRFGPGLKLKDHRITESVVRVNERLSYEEADKRVLESGSNEAVLFKIASSIRLQRVASGALIFRDPEVAVRLAEDGSIDVTLRERETAAQILVSELMIQANSLFAQFLKERNVPAVFRTQPPPLEKIVLGDHYDPVESYRAKKALARSDISVWPGPHSTLALDAYTTATSPLRRYTDLIVQRQLKSALQMQSPPLTAEQLEKELSEVSSRIDRANIMERQRQRYFLLKYIEQKREQEVEAIVLHRFPSFHLVRLSKFCLNAALHSSNHLLLNPGDRAVVRVDKINPRQDKLVVSLVRLM